MALIFITNKEYVTKNGKLKKICIRIEIIKIKCISIKIILLKRNC